MIAAASPLTFAPSMTQEDQSRADLYALLARLWYAGPDRQLLAAVASADELVGEVESSPLGNAWRALAAAAAAADEHAVRLEYDSVFVGTGKAEVTPFASHYLGQSFKERALVRLRDDLAALGLARDAAAHEPEDHVAALCDVMRHLIGRGSDAASLEAQKRFFAAYLGPVYEPFTQEALGAAGSVFYKHVARFTKSFFDIEVESFEML